MNTNVWRMPLALSLKYLTRVPDGSSRIKQTKVWQFLVYDNYYLENGSCHPSKKMSSKYNSSSLVADCAQYLE